MAPRIRTDVFPATVQVTTPADGVLPQVFEKARVILTTDTVLVYQDSPTGPALVYSERLASYDPGVPVHRRTRGTPARMPSATTDSGSEVTFTRSGGCGCGSRLKSFDPFSTTLNVAASNRDS